MESNMGQFHKKLQEILQYLQDTSPDFHHYFYNNYVRDEKYMLWATCYRLGALANTNMFAEAFHRVLKGNYFKSKQNRRIDHLVFILLKCARDKAIEQLIKSEKGKVTHRLKEVRLRHKTAKEIPFTAIQYVEGSKEQNQEEWHISSSTNANKQYSVRRITTCKQCPCKLVCGECGVCVHTFTCDCVDFLTRAMTCKHTHAVQMKQQENSDSKLADGIKTTDNTNDSAYLSTFVVQKDERDCNVQSNIQAGVAKVSELLNVLQTRKNVDTIKAMVKHINTAISVGLGLEDICDSANTFDSKHNFPSNKKFETQRSKFFSTKRKSLKRNKLKLKKPGRMECDKLTQELQSITPSQCAICNKMEDSGTSDNILWIQCTNCETWFHTECISQDVGNNEEFYCNFCNDPQTSP